MLQWILKSALQRQDSPCSKKLGLSLLCMQEPALACRGPVTLSYRTALSNSFLYQLTGSVVKVMRNEPTALWDPHGFVVLYEVCLVCLFTLDTIFQDTEL